MKKADEYYKEKEVCWVKLKGDPWWPGIISKIINRNQKIVYEIIYLGEKDKITVGKAFIKKWKENYTFYITKFNTEKKLNKKYKASFECALKIAELLDEQKINLQDNFNFVKHFQILKRKRNKESIIKYINEFNNSGDKIINNKIINDDDINDINTKDEINNDDNTNVNTNNEQEISFNKVRINIESWNINDEKEEKKNEIKENTNTYLRKRFKRSKSIKKLLKKKRKSNQDIEQDKINFDDISRDNEINMNQSDLNKMKNLLNSITNNIDKILEKSDKHQNYLKNEFSKIKFDTKDSRQINFKIGLISYMKIMCEILNVPMKLNKYIQSMTPQQI